MFGKVLNMPLVLFVRNGSGFGYFYRIKHCHKFFQFKIIIIILISKKKYVFTKIFEIR